MGYVCAKCGKKIKTLDKFARCAFCGNRILVKERPNVAKEVSSD